MAQLTQSLTVQVGESLRRFRVILRGEHFLLECGERKGFYVVRTALAENETMAGKLALFDFAAELEISARVAPCFLQTGSLAVEEAHPLCDAEEDVTSDFIYFPMD